MLAQRVGGVVEPHFGAMSLTLTVQVMEPLPRRPCPMAGLGLARHTSCEEQAASGALVHVCPRPSWANDVGRTETGMSCLWCCVGHGTCCA